jgi:hypothetical protein
MIKYLLLTTVICLVSNSCSSLGPPPNPRKYTDFIYEDHPQYTLEYSIGDRFATVKPMFLVESTDRMLWIRPPSSSSPSLEDYKKNYGSRPNRKQYQVKRLLPVGTEIELTAIKYSQMAGPIAYFVIDGDPTWVLADFDESEYKKVGDGFSIRRIILSEFYRKVQ